jgi:branched-chain amino acid transport system ATP-binding protein
VNNIEVIYDHVILVLKGVSLTIPQGGVVALLGANGAGKSTTLKAISNLLHVERGEVTKGAIEYLGSRIERAEAAVLVRRGIVQVMEGRRIFAHLTVEENLRAGAYTRHRGQAVGDDLERIYEYFPRLRERRFIKGGYISGGEQQMLAIGRALMARPKLMLLDEPSMGLAPMLVQEIFDIVVRLNQVLDGDAEMLRENDDIKEFYLGLTGVGQRRSYRDVKHYRRRKRWLS